MNDNLASTLAWQFSSVRAYVISPNHLPFRVAAVETDGYHVRRDDVVAIESLVNGWLTRTVVRYDVAGLWRLTPQGEELVWKAGEGWQGDLTWPDGIFGLTFGR